MPRKHSRAKAHIVYHKDGSVWARGSKMCDMMTGYWEWFRKDGTKLRSGYFEKGEQTGEWTTYDKKGAVYKVTHMKPKTKVRKAEQ
jgi:antitoxin component YwqK of YwqJK toxin-antitoxin module